MKLIKSFIDNSKPMLGYIDEFGNFWFDFQKEGVSKHFIITAILVEERLADNLEAEIEKVIGRFIQNDEIMLSNTEKNHQRRLLILEELQNLNFKIFTVIVDKRKIFQDSGLVHKDSFIKYLNGILYNELHNYFPKLQLTANQHGTIEFMDSFKKYLLTKHIPNLFGDYEFGFGDSKSELLIQLANFICGIIATGYENDEHEKEFQEYMEILKDKLLPIVYFPQEVEDYVKKLEQYSDGTFDSSIAYNSIKLAKKFIERNEKSKTVEVLEQVYVLKYLLSMLISQKSDYYVSSRDIINNLFEITGRDYTAHYFKTRIIAKLRDSGVLISSCQNGYKIPVREKEILAFVNQTSSMIKPMLDRLNICRDRVLTATGNEFDILKYPEYEYLKIFLDE